MVASGLEHAAHKSRKIISSITVSLCDIWPNFCSIFGINSEACRGETTHIVPGKQREISPAINRRRFSKLVLDTDTTADERARLMELTQRYCAVYQTPRHDSRMSMMIEAAGKTDAIGERVPG